MSPRVKEQIKKEEPAKEQEKKEGTSDETEQSYSVEKILASRKRAGRREYLIKWEGYPDEEATWEAECDCDCPDAIAEFNRNTPSRARGGKDVSTVMIGEETPKQSRGARRATMSETKGIEVPKRGRRRTISNNEGETSAKKTKVASEKPKKEEPDHNASATQNGVRSRRSLDNNDKSSAPQKRRSLKDRIKSEFSERGKRIFAVYKMGIGRVFFQCKKLYSGVIALTEICQGLSDSTTLPEVEYPTATSYEPMPAAAFNGLKESASTNPVNHIEASLCRVCERIYDGSQHFGIEVCRACAAFFRRSIEGRKKFICRRGANRCQLNG
ncbi:unnamed protein product [Haemonchus placei]|uniref:Chromo domain-containing protein n=1 Tax=Haemonchus placei TaxID=6290 RepID=A0A0N4WI11_HAEPC|nr:unnamed protein product [Haemonchus placei]